ncbi:hypothetical protein K7X08_033400 [Anisodus acutangulus]|uniref:Uncharacterized protein n=1 Tax=Anisodus acutangulus TaxID=402998 RepID=A0A9Q1RCI9_9SOLA|nr:hypothetical protein K7X08_033400 [Anisodus acutangulus]
MFGCKEFIQCPELHEMVEDVDLLVRRAERCLEAGADMIMINTDDLGRQADLLRSDFVKCYGPKVNLFVDHSQVMDLECLGGRNLGQNHSSLLGRSYFLL